MQDEDEKGLSLYLYERIRPEERIKIWPAGGDTIPSGTIQENRNYIFELENAINPDEVNLFVDEIPLEALRSKGNTAKWSWSTGFYAGYVNICLEIPQRRKEIFELITDADLRKLTRDRFNQMTGEILEDTLALFALSSFRTGIARGTSHLCPPIARIEFLRAKIEEIEKIVKQISEQPVRVLKSQEEWINSNRVNSFSGNHFLRSLSGSNMVRVENTDILDQLPDNLKGYFPKKVRQPVKTNGINIKEHQEIKSALKSWAAILDVYSAILGSSKEGDAEQQNQSSIWSKRCQMLRRRLLKLLELPLFIEVSDRSSIMLVSSIYRRIPIYHRFFQLYQDMNRGISNIFGDFLNLPLSRTYDLYELWCFLRMVRALHRRFSDLELNNLFGNYSPNSGSLVIPSGNINIPLPGYGMFSFQRSYSEFWTDRMHRGSFSRSMQPDLSLEMIEKADRIKIVVFDSKYRIENQLSDAISSIHMYRDAIVQANNGNPDSLNRIVVAAYILTPFIPNDSQMDWKKAGVPGRFFNREYLGHFKFGAVTLLPGMGEEEIDKVLEQILMDASANE